MERTAAPAEPAVTEPEPASGPTRLRSMVEWAGIIFGALIAALIIKTFLIQAFYIPSASMEPTLEVNDRVLVNKLSYRLHDVNRGDLVVFERPPGEDASDINELIKRVIGLPGEEIEAVDGVILIDGRALEEPYLTDGVSTDGLESTVVPDEHVFVLGDNRGDSRNSRRFGPIDEDLIVGRAFVRIWPLSAIGLL